MEQCQNPADKGIELKRQDATEELKQKLPKRELVLAICKKYGIPTEYKDRKGNLQIIDKSNIGGFLSIDFLLTSKPALETLLKTKLKEE